MFLYIAQISLVFTVFYTFYTLVFSKLTFHSINRFVLLSIIPISILLPLLDNLFSNIDIPENTLYIFKSLPYNELQLFNTEKNTSLNNIDYTMLLKYIYITSVCFCIIKLVISNIKLIKLKNKSVSFSSSDDTLLLANVTEVFSYFKWIFIPVEKKENYTDLIIEHEKNHIKLKHSIDILLAEIYKAFFWFNPLIYFYRKSLKSVHEFQADSKVIKSSNKELDYLTLLLDTIEPTKQNHLYNYFNHPILKRRILMITKSKSKALSKLKYLILLPLCGVFILAFSSSNLEHLKEVNTIISFAPPSETPSEIPSLFPVKNKSMNDITSSFGARGRHFKTKKIHIHHGIDIRAKTGTPVLATAGGIIVKSAREGNWGNLIIIKHTNGYETWYAHLNGFNIKEHQKVKRGDIIGYVGNTGLSSGPHLHYEIKLDGKHVNPADYLK